MAIFTDDFTGADGQLLTARSGWTQLGSGTCRAVVNAANQIKGVSGGDGSTVGVSTGGNNMFAQCTALSNFGTNDGWPLAVRVTDRNSYIAGRWNSVDSLWEIHTQFGRAGSAAGTFTAGATVRLEISGDTATMKQNGTTVLTTTVPTITAANNAAIFLRAAHDPVMDNWVSGQIGEDVDVTAPTLTSATATATSATTATGGVTTDEAGPAWAVLTTSSTTPSAAQIKAGQNHLGAAASASATATLSVGANPGVFSFTGLTGGGTYWPHVVQDDAVPNTSTPITSASSITTPAPDTTPPTMNGSITVGTKTSGSISISYPAASDNVAVTGYEVSTNGSTWSDNSTSLSYTFLGLSALTSYTLYVRAYDAAGNRAATPLTVTTSTYRAGDTATNILANTGPVGGNPAGFLYAFASTVSGTDWLSYTITSGPTPSGGTLTANPDGTFTYVGPDAATMVIQPEVNGVNSAETITVTLYDQTADTTPPVLTGSITVTSLTSTGYNLSWPTGTDNIGVTAYEYSLNGGSSWTSQSGTSVSITGRTPETTDQVRVRAKDAAGNVSTPALSTSVTLLAAPDVTAPLLTSPTGAKLGANGAVGSVSTNEATGSLFWITTINATETKPAVLLGSSQPVTVIGIQNVTSSGLTPLTTYYNHFVHRDAVGNESLVASSAAFTTDAAGAVVTSKFNDGEAMRSCMWHPMKKAINA